MEAVVEATGADELMVAAHVFDHRARLRSFEIVADVHREAASREPVAAPLMLSNS